MTVTLGGITLDESLALPGFKNRRPVVISSQPTILGREVVQSAPVLSGQRLVLEARLDGQQILGHFTGTQIDAIRALWDGSTIPLVHHLGSWQVVIESIDVYEVQDYADPVAADLYVGTVTMIEV
jgi:hypothetical protein